MNFQNFPWIPWNWGYFQKHTMKLYTVLDSKDHKYQITCNARGYCRERLTDHHHIRQMLWTNHRHIIMLQPNYSLSATTFKCCFISVVCASQGCSCLCFLLVKFVFIVVNNCIMVVNFASFGSFWQWQSVSCVHFCRCLFNLEYFVTSFGLSTQWSQGRHCHVIRSWHAVNIPPVL